MTYTREHARRHPSLRHIRPDTSGYDISSRADQIEQNWRKVLNGWRYDDTMDECAGEGELG